MSFVHTRRVRFGDCDPAGIAYFPRFFDWFHQAMEQWFDEGLGIDYAGLIASGHGMPCVHTEADFKAPCRLGDVLHIHLAVAKRGGSSVVLEYRVVGDDGVLRATGQSVVLHARLTGTGVVPVRISGALADALDRES